MKIRLAMMALCALAVLPACDDASDLQSFQAQIVAEPGVQGNAPLRVRLRAVSNGPLDAQYSWLWQFGDDATSEAAEPEHVFTEPGTYEVTVAVTAAGQGSGTASQTIEVGASADLQITDVGFGPRRTQAGGSVEVAWVLNNAGAEVLAPWRLQVVLSQDEIIDARDVVVLEQRFSGEPERAVEGSTQIELPADIASGDWFLAVAADPDGAIGDLNRGDNTTWAPFTVQVRNPTDNGPDLVSCGLEIPAFDDIPVDQTPVAQLGDQLPVEVCIANLGNGLVAVGDYSLYLSADTVFDPTDRRIGGRSGFALGAGDQAVFDDLVELPLMDAAGRWRVLVVADPDEGIDEQREDNNTRAWAGEFELAEAGAVEGVDLVITALTINEAAAFWGQVLTGTLRLNNRGNVAVERSFVVRIFAQPEDGTEPIQLRSLNRAGIEAGADEEIPLQLSINRRLAQGSYRIYAQADPTNSTDDVNPSNNQRTVQQALTLGGEPDFDLVLGPVSLDAQTVAAGGMLEVRAEVSNPGGDATGAFEWAVVISADAALSGDVQVLDLAESDSLEPAGSRALIRSVRIPEDLDQQVPEWFVGVVLDPANRLTGERAEDNNQAAGPPLVVEGAMGGCAEDAPNEPNDVAAQAVALAPGLTEGLGICDDADWFTIAVPAGQVLDVALIHGDTTPQLRLLDEAGNELVVAEDVAGRLEAFVPPSEAARAVLLEITDAGAPQQYALEVGLSALVDQANLRVRAVGVVPGVAEAGAPVEVGFEVLNVGGEAAPAFDASIMLRSAAGIETALGRVAFEALDAGATRRGVLRVELPALLDDGLYAVRVLADVDAAVDEADETDNAADGALRIDAEQACAADPFEPNHSGEDARATAVEAGSFPDLTTCAGDDDWYGVVLDAGERLNVRIDFSNAEGDLELALYDRDGETVLDRSDGFQDSEAVQLLRAPEAGTYFVRVFLNPADQINVANTYAMDVVIAAADACVDDGFEPNAGRETAQLLPDGAHDLTLCAGDEDWFRFNIPVGNIVSFQVASGAAGVRIALFGPDALLIDEDARRISHEAAETGFYYLRARVNAEAPVPYSLTVAGVSGVDLEVLDVRLSSVAAEPGEDLRLDLTVANNRGDAANDVLVRYLLSADERPSADDLVIAEARVPQIGGAAATLVRQRLTLPAEAPAGPAFVVVDLDPERDVADLRPGNNQGAVALEVIGACQDDDPRSNEGPRTATALDPEAGALENGVICAFTEDWFTLPVANAGAVTVTVAFAHGEGDLDLQIWDAEANALLGESRTEANEESVDLVLDAAGAVLIRVDGFLDARNDYRLSWTLP
jgi:PKD repeat protein